MVNASTNLNELKTLAPIFELLGTVWLYEIDVDVAKVWNDAAEFTAEVLQEPAVVIEVDQLEDLATEYCSLFIGPKQHFPPIQSIWTSGQLDSSATKSMSLYCERLGFAADRPDVPCDHLGLQLQVFAALLHGVSPDDDDTAPEVIEEFTVAHLQWADDLLNGVLGVSSGFYNQIARLTQQLLSED